MILGECIEQIGDEKLHGKAEREWTQQGASMTGGKRKTGFGRSPDDYGVFDKNGSRSHFPLWTAGDFRHTGGGISFTLAGPTEFDWKSAAKGTNQLTKYTAYHFHNFFDDMNQVRHKVSREDAFMGY